MKELIRNLVFDLGNVLIEWNSEKILTTFEPEKERRQILRQAIFDSDVWHQTDKGELSLKEACDEVLAQLDDSYHPAVQNIFYNWYEVVEVTVVYRSRLAYGLIKVIAFTSCQLLARFFTVLKKLVCCPSFHCWRAISFPQKSGLSSQS